MHTEEKKITTESKSSSSRENDVWTEDILEWLLAWIDYLLQGGPFTGKPNNFSDSDQ